MFLNDIVLWTRQVRIMQLLYSVLKVVHILPGRSQKETLNLLFSVYGRIPNSFEVYHCRRNTTDKDLQFIFDRAKAFR